MSHLLSIIIPCYNCVSTLKQAVDSVYQQSLNLPWEIVMVDDGSQDGTGELILSLCKQRPEIRSFSHSKNRGGGAARNTAVLHSKGDLIFCLDSDDVLGKQMLSPMIEMLIDRKLDGVGIHYSRKFIGNNLNRIAFTTKMGYVNEPIPFESLFENSTCALYSTFLHTKKAFVVCGGYPTDHGFDTQSFAFRFLGNGLKAQVCPKTTYYHRLYHGKSYYVREFESGKICENWMKIYEEFLFIFSDEVKKGLLKIDTQDQLIMPQQVIEQAQDKFSPDYRSFIKNDCTREYKKSLQRKKSLNPYELYWLGCQSFMLEETEQAVDYFFEAFKHGLMTKRVLTKVIEAVSRLNEVDSKDILAHFYPAPKRAITTLFRNSYRKSIYSLVGFVRKFI